MSVRSRGWLLGGGSPRKSVATLLKLARDSKAASLAARGSPATTRSGLARRAWRAPQGSDEASSSDLDGVDDDAPEEESVSRGQVEEAADGGDESCQRGKERHAAAGLADSDPFDLRQRFIAKQKIFFRRALKEIRAGSKDSHWYDLR